MNKKLIAVAIAAAVAAPAAMAETTLYGKIHMDIRSTDEGKYGVDNWTVNSNASRLGVKGSEDLGNGMKAIFQYETTYSGTDSSEAFGGARNSYIGLAGNWGQVRVGRHDTPMKVAFYGAGNEHIADSIVDINRIGFTERRVNNAIAYISPSFSGFTLLGAVVPGEQSGQKTGGWDDELDVNLTNCTMPFDYYDGPSNSDRRTCDVASVSEHYVTQKNNENGLMDSYSLGLIYGGNGLKASVGYESLADFGNAADESDDEVKTWQAGASYTFGNFTLGGQYEDTDLEHSDYTVWALMGKAKFGNNAFVANYGQAEWDFDGCSSCDDEVDTIQLALEHSFSKRTSVYVAYRNQDWDDGFDDDDVDTFALGMIHNF
jgi:predicted porin